jgi:hypothetical protein
MNAPLCNLPPYVAHGLALLTEIRTCCVEKGAVTKNDRYLRQNLPRQNAPIFYTRIGEGNTLFLLPEGIENNRFDGFFLTVKFWRKFIRASSAGDRDRDTESSTPVRDVPSGLHP